MIINNNISFGMKYPKIPKESLEAMLNAGRSYSEIASAYNIPKQSVFRLAKCYDIKMRSQIVKEKKQEKILELYCQGVPVNEIGKYVQASLKHVKIVVNDFIAKHTPQPRESYSDPLVREIIKKLKINPKNIEDSLI